jgi:hypothetical protein
MDGGMKQPEKCLGQVSTDGVKLSAPHILYRKEAGIDRKPVACIATYSVIHQLYMHFEAYE